MKITIDQIANLNELPLPAQAEVLESDSLEYRSFHAVQEILGWRNGKIVLGIAGQFKMFWPHGKKEDLFEITSYGSDTYQWWRGKETE